MDDERAQELGMALLMLGIDRLTATDLYKVFSFAGIYACYLFTNETLKALIGKQISRWPTDDEVDHVRTAIRCNMQLQGAVNRALDAACKPLGRG